jgi:hypothetical protein
VSPYNDKDSGKSISQQIRELHDKNLPMWRPYWEAMDQEERFLDGDRYVNNADWHNRDRRRIQIRGRETDDTIRHILSKATSKPRSVEARPIDMQGDPDQAEVEVALVEQELSNPLKMFEQCVQDSVWDARAIGLGITWMDWVPSVGPWGEMIYSSEDPRRYMWKWGYHPHHLMCDWLFRSHRYDVDYAREALKAPWLQPDRESARLGRLSPDQPLLLNHRTELVGLTSTDDQVTLLECWYKNDRSVKGKKEVGERVLEKPERYMVCVDGCGYRSETQAVLQAQEKIQGGLPEMIEEGCPECGGALERVDTLGKDQPRLAYANGRRLVIVSPYCASKDDAPVWDKPWPVPTARSFPILVLTAYPRRGRPRGDSDTSWCWDQQQAADHLRTMAVQRTFEHRTYKLTPGEGIKNTKGKRFEFRDDDFDVMIRDNTAMGPLDVQFFNASGLDPAWPIAFQPIYQALTQYRGMYDQGPIDDRSAKSGVALQTENAIGEIPVENFIQRKNFELSLFYGVVSDYIHATYPAQRLVRLNLEGVDLVSQLWGKDMANYDFVIEETPDFSGLEKARSEAWDAAMQIMMNPAATPELLESWAKFHQVPRSVMRDLIKAMPMMQQIAQATAEREKQQVKSNAESAAGIKAELEGVKAGLNGAGAVPEPVV